jgi:hypothetical protein
MDKNNPSYLGKLRGNASGSIYQLYDNGLQPSGILWIDLNLEFQWVTLNIKAIF